MKQLLAFATAVSLMSSCDVLTGETNPNYTARQGAKSSPTSRIQLSFVPETYEEGGRIVMPVTFPDGTTAELAYPPELDLAALHVQPYSSAYAPGVGRDFLVYDRPFEDVVGAYEAAELLAEYDDGHGGTVGFWRLPPDGLYLAFHFGSWTVLVYDYGEEGAQMSDEDRALWSTNFHGRDAEDGFLLLEAEPPLTLAKAGEHAGPELEFWSRSDLLKGILLFPGKCTPYREAEDGFDHIEMINGRAVDRSNDFAAWCIPEASMTVHVYQEPRETFIDQVLEGLEVRSVSVASSP